MQFVTFTGRFQPKFVQGLIILYLQNQNNRNTIFPPPPPAPRGPKNRYGVVALGVAALTPLPYSIICWACGATGMRLSIFLTVSLLRIPRVFAYLWFIEKTLTHV